MTKNLQVRLARNKLIKFLRANGILVNKGVKNWPRKVLNDASRLLCTDKLIPENKQDYEIRLAGLVKTPIKDVRKQDPDMTGYEIIHDHPALSTYRKLISMCRLKDAKEGHKHHIVPRAMKGGNESENMILLSISDHIQLHQVLANCLAGTTYDVYRDKMAYAAAQMSKPNYGKPRNKTKILKPKKANKKKLNNNQLLTENVALLETIKQKDAEIDSLLEQLADARKTPEDINKELDIQQLYKIS